MKKILVSGSSVAAGTGFSKEIIDPDTWPNQLKKKLDCNLDNVSVGGCDVSQSLFHAVSAMNKTYYDLVLIEIPPLNRLPITPNIKGILEIGGKLNYSDLTAWHQWFDKSLHISKRDIDTTLKVIFWLNTDWMHWKKLLGVITTVQLLNEKKLVIRFVNNGIDCRRLIHNHFYFLLLL